jgi:hypothetical protein
MLRKKGALAGGMPLYKWIGNQVLTRIENLIVGADFSEFHTGYRAYRIDALQQIPFHYNTNNFHFDTDILIQMLRVNAVFREIPIPTHYGDEVCHVNGWRYFYDCIRSCWHDWLTRKGISYYRRFDLAPPRGGYGTKLGLKHSSAPVAMSLVPEGSKVPGIGSGHGLGTDAIAGTAPPFPALRSNPMALSWASSRKQIPRRKLN